MVYSPKGPYHLGRVSNKEHAFVYNPINLYKKWTEATFGNNVSIHGDGNLGDLLYFHFDFHSHLWIFYHPLINVVMNKYYIDSYDNDVEISICNAICVIWLDPAMVHTRKSSEGEYSLMISYRCAVALWRFCALPCFCFCFLHLPHVLSWLHAIFVVKNQARLKPNKPTGLSQPGGPEERSALHLSQRGVRRGLLEAAALILVSDKHRCLGFLLRWLLHMWLYRYAIYILIYMCIISVKPHTLLTKAKFSPLL